MRAISTAAAAHHLADGAPGVHHTSGGAHGVHQHIGADRIGIAVNDHWLTMVSLHYICSAFNSRLEAGLLARDSGK